MLEMHWTSRDPLQLVLAAPVCGQQYSQHCVIETGGCVFYTMGYALVKADTQCLHMTASYSRLYGCPPFLVMKHQNFALPQSVQR